MENRYHKDTGSMLSLVEDYVGLKIGDRYLIDRFLDAGSFGKVYKLIDL